MIEVSRASPQDADLLAIRAEDLAEIALYGMPMSPAEGLRKSIASSPEAWKAIDPSTGEVFSIFGVGEAFSPEGVVRIPWMVSSETVSKFGRDCVRIGRAVRRNLQQQAARGAIVKNYISKAAVKNRAFVERVGYVITHVPDSPFDLFGLP
jgi:hypothetical protein